MTNEEIKLLKELDQPEHPQGLDRGTDVLKTFQSLKQMQLVSGDYGEGAQLTDRGKEALREATTGGKTLHP